MKKIIFTALISCFVTISFAQSNSNSSDSSSGNTLTNAMNQAQSQQGSFNQKVSNPFIFCSGPKPGKYDPMRIVWEQICSSANAQPAAAPVPVPTGNPIKDTKEVLNQLNAPAEITNSVISNPTNNKVTQQVQKDVGYATQK